MMQFNRHRPANRGLRAAAAGMLIAGLAAGVPASSRPGAPPAAKEVILKLRADFATGQIRGKGANLEAYLARSFPAVRIAGARPVTENAIDTPLENTFVVALAEAEDPAEFIRAARQKEQVVYIQPNHRLPVDQAALNDSLFAAQWGIRAVAGPEAWKVTTGSPAVPIAVIDTGIDYHHPDLRGRLWVNQAEDRNGNGVLDAADLNGIDDDGNGFVDDVIGWDFTDTQIFIDGGDYRDRDNDPMDENGHGTAIAGIIGARAGNGIGIAGLAYGCPIMNLRAGTSFGFLEEDDVAAAIVYAVKNGARVINMSFGDVVVSPMLRDVIRYAYERGVVLVASSGNSASDTPHYPS